MKTKKIPSVTKLFKRNLWWKPRNDICRVAPSCASFKPKGKYGSAWIRWGNGKSNIVWIFYFPIQKWATLIFNKENLFVSSTLLKLKSSYGTYTIHTELHTKVNRQYLRNIEIGVWFLQKAVGGLMENQTFEHLKT